MARHAAVPNNVIHSPANRNALYVGAAIIGVGSIGRVSAGGTR